MAVKTPFVQKTNYFEKRFLEWDGNPNSESSRVARRLLKRFSRRRRAGRGGGPCELASASATDDPH
jgi:hypothetical protein